ncbi:MAG: T9SS type A sorting domain-containing protein [Bacteroidota bacterium]|nr:T9SS type A sorting domain-containing protein [Bacteroidota bacterium]MDP4232272.1 T9SS type A sorting domain-containing protein [Bacteroidota bacterium]MDP4242673.1 T9SS type A sorting domain-containing protein [Bacteroidota bacterium]MDP4286765.1 T9SS type A sorting domain-containing protein [Bacteroidota bacterium]
MKRIIFFFWILLIASPCRAQWVGIALGAQVEAFGVHDSLLFIGSADHVYRYTVAHGYGYADTGIDFTQGGVTSFASLGRYFFVHTQYDYRTPDNGSTWTRLSRGCTLGTNGVYLFACTGGTTYRSGDSGDNWQAVPGPGSVTMFAATGSCVFASTSSNIWRSIDNGGTWAKISSPIATINSFAFLGTLTFGANGPIVKSTDSGTHWTEIDLPRRSVTQLAASGSNLFAGTDSGVFVSVDSGLHWRAVNDGLGNYHIVNALGVFDTLLFVNARSGVDNYTAKRRISEMVDTPKSAVQAIPQPRDTLSIYPNPATGLVTIFAGSTAIEHVSVLNVLGVNVFEAGGSTTPYPRLEKAGEFYSLDLSQLPSGTYFLRIETAKGSVLRKLVRE